MELVEKYEHKYLPYKKLHRVFKTLHERGHLDSVGARSRKKIIEF